MKCLQRTFQRVRVLSAVARRTSLGTALMTAANGFFATERLVVATAEAFQQAKEYRARRLS